MSALMSSIYRDASFPLVFKWPLTLYYGRSREGFVLATTVSSKRIAGGNGTPVKYFCSKDIPRDNDGRRSNDRDHRKNRTSHRQSWPPNAGDVSCLHARRYVGRILRGGYQTLMQVDFGHCAVVDRSRGSRCAEERDLDFSLQLLTQSRC